MEIEASEWQGIADGTADSQSLVRFDTNDYSVPVQYAHRKLIVVATVEEVRLVFEDRLVFVGVGVEKPLKAAIAAALRND